MTLSWRLERQLQQLRGVIGMILGLNQFAPASVIRDRLVVRGDNYINKYSLPFTLGAQHKIKLVVVVEPCDLVYLQL